MRLDRGLLGLALLTRPPHPTLLPTFALTSAGGGPFDAPYIEYNGVLASPADLPAVERAFLTYLSERPRFTHNQNGWTRLRLPGVQPDFLASCSAAGLHAEILNECSCPFVDLDQLRHEDVSYLESRSRNCRYQIKRSMRLFAERGALRLERPATLDAAFEIFDDLKTLHQRYWIARGQGGAFQSPFFEQFHRALIRSAWDYQEIDLVRLKAGQQTLGCLYNFLYDGQAYSYQSGFLTEDAPHLKPGLVSHALATQGYLEAGLRRYLFLAGGSRYKTSLSTGADTLYWLETSRRTGPDVALRFAEKTARIGAKLPRFLLRKIGL